jgi:hypothetical protein
LLFGKGLSHYVCDLIANSALYKEIFMVYFSLRLLCPSVVQCLDK